MKIGAMLAAAGVLALTATPVVAQSLAKLRPFLVAADWRPTLLGDRVDLSAWVKPKVEQLELFGA